MIDLFEDQIHEMVTDATGSVVGHLDSVSDGHAMFSDTFGNISHHITSMPGGGMNVTDAFGNTVAKVAELSDGALHITDTIGSTISTVRESFGGATLFDAFSRPMASFDPVSGNISDALGRITGGIRSY